MTDISVEDVFAAVKDVLGIRDSHYFPSGK